MKRSIIALVMLFCGSLHAATETYYIDQDVSGGAGDGSSWANAYQTWALFQTAKAADLTTAEKIYHVYFRCSSGTAAAAFTVSSGSWTTNSSYYLILEVDDSYCHHGLRDATKYRAVGSSYTAGVTVQVDYTRLIGFQFRSILGHGVSINARNCLLQRILAYDCGDAGIRIEGSKPNGVLTNCASYSSGDKGYELLSGCTLYQCVGANNVTANLYVNNATATCTNCYMGGVSTSYVLGTYGTVSLTTCYSDDGAQSSTVAAFATDSGGYFTNVTDTTEDLHISTDSSLKDNGTDISASIDPDEDIDNEPRAMGAGWDVGIDEFAVAPSKATTPDPADDETDVTLSQILSWVAGTGAATRNVYFEAASPPTVKVIDGGTALTYDPTLAYDTTYYWRVDEINGAGTTTGDEWSFTTGSEPLIDLVDLWWQARRH